MRLFTTYKRNDTAIEKDGDGIFLYFTPDLFTMESDVYYFKHPQQELFQMIADYMEIGKYAEIFDEMTLPAQEALYSALLWLNQRGLEV